MRRASRSPAPSALHPLELRILLVIGEAPTHGYRIVKEVERLEAGRFKLYPANLYRRLHGLRDMGFVAEVPAPAGEDGGKRPRTYFDLTALGRSAVHEELARLEALVRDARSALDPA